MHTAGRPWRAATSGCEVNRGMLPIVLLRGVCAQSAMCIRPAVGCYIFQEQANASCTEVYELPGTRVGRLCHIEPVFIVCSVRSWSEWAQ
jgi:hypothetical protein